MSLLLSWLFLSFSVWGTSLIVPGFRLKEGPSNAIVVAAMFGVLNATLGVVLFHMIGLSTLLLGYLLAFVTRTIVSAIVLVVVDKLSDRLKIESFFDALQAAISIGVAGAIGDWIAR